MGHIDRIRSARRQRVLRHLRQLRRRARLSQHRQRRDMAKPRRLRPNRPPRYSGPLDRRRSRRSTTALPRHRYRCDGVDRRRPHVDDGRDRIWSGSDDVAVADAHAGGTETVIRVYTWPRGVARHYSVKLPMAFSVRGYLVLLLAAVGVACGQAATSTAPSPISQNPTSSLSTSFDALAMPA